MKEICPISSRQVNEKAVQINAVLTIFSLILYFFTKYEWIIIVLSADFFIRGFLDPLYSPYSAVSKTILRLLKNTKPAMVNAEPKIFAAKLGFIFCFMIMAFSLVGYYRMSFAIGSLLGFFAALEAVFKFCLACKVYPYICKMNSSGPESTR